MSNKKQINELEKVTSTITPPWSSQLTFSGNTVTAYYDETLERVQIERIADDEQAIECLTIDINEIMPLVNSLNTVYLFLKKYNKV